jgi:hypothetical protein
MVTISLCIIVKFEEDVVTLLVLMEMSRYVMDLMSFYKQVQQTLALSHT